MTIKTSRSILDELDLLVNQRDKENIVESRATHVIQSAINLINMIQENYSMTEADELERRLINSIKGRDTAKFTRGIRRIKESRNSED